MTTGLIMLVFVEFDLENKDQLDYISLSQNVKYNKKKKKLIFD